MLLSFWEMEKEKHNCRGFRDSERYRANGEERGIVMEGTKAQARERHLWPSDAARPLQALKGMLTNFRR